MMQRVCVPKNHSFVTLGMVEDQSHTETEEWK